MKDELGRNDRALRSWGALLAASLVTACAGELEGNPDTYKVQRSEQGGASARCDRAPEIFASICIACHSTNDHLGSLDLESPGVESRLLDQASANGKCTSRKLIDSAAPDRSYLFEKLTSDAPQCGDRMPAVGEIDAADVDCIRVWAASLATGDAGSAAGAADAARGGDQ